MSDKKRHIINIKIPAYLNAEREAIEKYVREFIVQGKQINPF